MNEELERLVKSLDAYLEGKEGIEAARLLARYESLLEIVCVRTGTSKEMMDRSVQRAYERWRSANRIKFPTIPPQA